MTRWAWITGMWPRLPVAITGRGIADAAYVGALFACLLLALGPHLNAKPLGPDDISELISQTQDIRRRLRDNRLDINTIEQWGNTEPEIASYLQQLSRAVGQRSIDDQAWMRDVDRRLDLVDQRLIMSLNRLERLLSEIADERRTSEGKQPITPNKLDETAPNR